MQPAPLNDEDPLQLTLQTQQSRDRRTVVVVQWTHHALLGFQSGLSGVCSPILSKVIANKPQCPVDLAFQISNLQQCSRVSDERNRRQAALALSTMTRMSAWRRVSCSCSKAMRLHHALNPLSYNPDCLSMLLVTGHVVTELLAAEVALT